MENVSENIILILIYIIAIAVSSCEHECSKGIDGGEFVRTIGESGQKLRSDLNKIERVEAYLVKEGNDCWYSQEFLKSNSSKILLFSGEKARQNISKLFEGADVGKVERDLAGSKVYLVILYEDGQKSLLRISRARPNLFLVKGFDGWWYGEVSDSEWLDDLINS